MEDFLRFKCPYIDKKEIWEKAEKVRKDYWPENTIPVDIEIIIEQRIQLHIIPIHSLSSDYDTDAYLRSDLTGIVVDHKQYMDDRYINRLRFSFAHEIGHLILHKDIYQRFGITDPDKWKSYVLHITDKEYNWFEYQANEFAGRLLVPVDLLTTELKKCLELHHNSRLIDLLSKDPDAVLAAIGSILCKPFGVSDKVISIRVEKEGLWPPDHY